jgi:LGFP repeat
MTRIYRLLCLLCLGACADLGDADSAQQNLAAEDGDYLATTCTPPRCPLMRLPEGFTEIHAKLETIPSALREAYFADPTHDVLPTPDGAAYHQWFAGSAGRGAIYHVRELNPVGPTGTHYIYGAILEEWALNDYERGAGYFKDPETLALTGEGEIAQEFGLDFEWEPSVANGGLLRTRNMYVLHGDGSVEHRPVNEYLVSNSPGAPSLYRQLCTLDYYWIPESATYITPAVSFDGYVGGRCDDCRWVLWCGPGEPPGMPWHPHP